MTTATRWTLRIAAVGLWGAAANLARVSFLHPSTFRVLLAVLLLVWGIAIWRRNLRAVWLLFASLLAVAMFVPMGLINPFHVLDADPAVVAAPNFAARTIGTALVLGGMAFAGAAALLRAAGEMRQHTLEPGTCVRNSPSRRRVILALGIAWLVLAMLFVPSFLNAIRSIKRARSIYQQATSTSSLLPSLQAGASADRGGGQGKVGK